MNQAPEFGISWAGLLVIGFVALLLLKVITTRRTLALAAVLLSLAAAVGIVALYSLGSSPMSPYVAVPWVGPPPMPMPIPPPPESAPRGMKAVSTSSSPHVAAEINDAIPVEISGAAVGASERPRPAWVDEKPSRVGGDYFVTVKAGPHVSLELCLQDLPGELQRATQVYIDTLVNKGAGRRVVLPPGYVEKHIVIDEWTGPYKSVTGDYRLDNMLEHYARLHFNDGARQEILRRHHEALVTERLEYSAVSAGMVLLLLGTLFGYLRLDTATKGYYSGRLKLVATATILAGSAATAMFVKSIAS